MDILTNAIKVTLGPNGRNVVIDKPFGLPHITKDGVSVAREIELKDPIQNLGVKLVREVASKTCDDAWDGTTTATVLAQAIVTAGLKNIAAGANPIDLKRGIDKVIEAVEAPIRQIIKNAGRKDDIILAEIEDYDLSFGYNARTGICENLLDGGVIDLAKVTRTALQNAASIAELFLTTECTIASEIAE